MVRLRRIRCLRARCQRWSIDFSELDQAGRLDCVIPSHSGRSKSTESKPKRLKMESDKVEVEEAMQAVADEKAMFVDL